MENYSAFASLVKIKRGLQRNRSKAKLPLNHCRVNSRTIFSLCLNEPKVILLAFLPLHLSTLKDQSSHFYCFDDTLKVFTRLEHMPMLWQNKAALLSLQQNHLIPQDYGRRVIMLFK